MNSSSSVPGTAKLIELTVSRSEAREKLTERIQKAEEIGSRVAAGDVATYEKWNVFNRELLLRLFTLPELSYEYSNTFAPRRGVQLSGRQTSGSTYLDRLGAKRRCIESIIERLELYTEPAPEGSAPSGNVAKLGAAQGRKVFVVHGHDEAAREAVARFLERIDLSPVILHEQANQGRTIIEKFELHSDVGFAVVLLTPDDLGKAVAAPELAPRARQNVVLELGYFVGRLGRNRVCTLKKGAIDIPSDVLGVVWTEMDGAGAWQMALGRELDAAGYSLDWNLVMRGR